MVTSSKRSTEHRPFPPPCRGSLVIHRLASLMPSIVNISLPHDNMMIQTKSLGSNTLISHRSHRRFSFLGVRIRRVEQATYFHHYIEASQLGISHLHYSHCPILKSPPSWSIPAQVISGLLCYFLAMHLHLVSASWIMLANDIPSMNDTYRNLTSACQWPSPSDDTMLTRNPAQNCQADVDPKVGSTASLENYCERWDEDCYNSLNQPLPT